MIREPARRTAPFCHRDDPAPLRASALSSPPAAAPASALAARAAAAGGGSAAGAKRCAAMRTPSP